MAADAQERDPVLQELLDERDIRRVIMNFCRASDRHDFELLRSCYHDDATDNHGVFVGSAADYLDWCEENLPGMGGSSMHFIGNQIIELDGPTDARAESYVLGFFRYTREDGTKADWRSGGRYVDRFEKRGGEWRISDRVLVWEWAADTAVEMEFEGFGLDTSQFVWTKRAPEDLIYAAARG